MDPKAEFREFGRQAFDFSAYRSFEFMATWMLPFAVKAMNIKFFSSETTKFLKKAFWDTIREREEKNIHREDIVQLLIQLKNEDAKANDVAPHNGVSKGAAEGDVSGKLTRRVLCGQVDQENVVGKFTRNVDVDRCTRRAFW